jgi:NADH-quinone oxidoreductase subunit L
MNPMLYGKPALLSNAITVLPQHNVLAEMSAEEQMPFSMMTHAFGSGTFMLTVFGIFVAWLCYIAMPQIPALVAKYFSWIHRLLLNKYGFDAFNEKVLIPLTKGFGHLFYCVGDRGLIDGMVVNGSAKVVSIAAKIGRLSQTGYIFHYAFAMVLGLIVFLLLLV